ncbi:hypothetical protein [Streptomyces reniochalinae]|uniref:Uncharacterized protein n=1 Tax=Streptomyces reniochalinae TaxID=2250578 RepID=A0A367EYJ9_9ACTN|nr:hypothetical protein [Streptomyces reniochalinae]RCG23236.1 hypothetical protein DQ392_04750 [Streptomyces reniochalinae]
METGHSYADEGSYRSQRRTTVRGTAYVTTARGGRTGLSFTGEADPGTSYRLTVGSRSRTVTGRALMSGEPLSFSLPRGRVVPVTLTRAHPAHPGEDLKARVRRLTLTP